MSITLHWWVIPIVLVLAANGLLAVSPRGRDYDFTPIFYAAGALCLVSAAIAFILGHYLL